MIGTAGRIARALETILSAMVAEREPDYQTAADVRAGIKAGKGPRGKDEAMEERSSIFCPSCRHSNPHENRFCGACGTALASGDQLARRPENSPAATPRTLLPAELKPVGKALAVGLAALAAEAGLAWLRHRAADSHQSSLPVVAGTEPAVPERPIYQSFEELHLWLREGNFESRTFAQRTVRSFRTTNPTDEQR